MRKSRFTEQQIAFALRQAETGTKVSEVCRKIGVAEATFYNWKKYGGLGVSELRRLLYYHFYYNRRILREINLNKLLGSHFLFPSAEKCYFKNLEEAIYIIKSNIPKPPTLCLNKCKLVFILIRTVPETFCDRLSGSIGIRF